MGFDSDKQDLHDARARSRETPPEWDEPPPFVGTWNRVYLAVVIYTFILLVALYVMTITLNR